MYRQMDYPAALDYIHGAGSFSSCACLRRIEALVEELGTDLTGTRFIHVAGTNGKGSTCAMLESILRAAGYKAGLFTSPYLVDFCERMQIDRERISHDRLARLTDKVRAAAERIIGRGVEKPNEFEIVTAIALEYFIGEKCDFVLWETGLGGGKDATNVIPPPVLAVITSVSFDHMAQLGDTLPEIAGEKCGIIKNGTPFCVAGKNPPEVMEVIEDVCARAGVRLVKAGTLSGRETLAGTELSVDGRCVHLPLLGKYQLENAANAVAAAKCLSSLGCGIDEESIVRGLEAVRWQGRMEVLGSEPPVILDCAHNVGGFESLLASVREISGGREIVALTAMMGDKEHEKCLNMLAETCSRVYVTGLDMPRCLPPETAARELETAGCVVRVVPELPAALKTAREELKEDELLLICGSVYLAGTVRAIATE